ncbi:MAG: UvrD-helicase domain-containing protein [Chloracidobacterium sp.]|nr:UvrD-helicase domain-containing protein [Chloracidobacterium sp.]
MSLTTQQLEAAQAPRSVAVTAGAGTGKTHMLASRYLHHIETDGLSPLEIVAVTFTDKAAAQLRSRIRETIAASTASNAVIAEVEAGQISTMHALAARICRDFYYIAGIPADFEILDDADSPMWVAAQFEESIGEIDPAIVGELGYTWLGNALRQLMQDPLASEMALARGSANWEVAIRQAADEAQSELISSDAWQNARHTLPSFSGASGDLLETSREDALIAIANAEGGRNIAEALGVLKSVRTNVGTAKNWIDGGKDDIQACLRDLKANVSELFEQATLQFTADESELGRQLKLLEGAFEQLRTSLQAAKLRQRVLDFSDLEVYALKALRDPSVRAHYAARWRAFLVDEFQDTNPVQADILKLLTAGIILTIVGDEKQAIYGFRGADINVFSEFRSLILSTEGGKEVPLSRTFRSHAPLVDTMNRIFAPVLAELRQDLEADRSEPRTGVSAPFITVNVVEKIEGTYKRQQLVVEARFIAEKIREITNSGEIQYGDIAILSRAWAPLDVYADVLAAEGIPAVHAGGGSLLATREALDACAAIDFLAYPHDDIPLATLLRSPFFAVSDKMLFEFVSAAPQGISWWAALGTCDIGELERAYSVLSRVLAARVRKRPSELLNLLDDLTGYSAVVSNLAHGSRREADWRGMLALLRKQEMGGRGDIFGLSRYFKQLFDAEIDIPRPPLDSKNAVSLMTVHKAKGLEWPVVFIPDLARDVKTAIEPLMIDTELGVAFQMESDGYEKTEPSIYKLLKKRKVDRESEESKRVLYVAMTRAEEKVVLSATKEKGHAVDLLRPGLQAAGIPDEQIPYRDALAIPPAPGEPKPFVMPERIQIEPLRVGLTSIPVTALTAYAQCPKRFHYRYVTGHPGLGEGFATASSIGTLAHKALELDLDDLESLRPFADGLENAQVNTALELARAFRSANCFAEVRGMEVQKEVQFRYQAGPVTLYGTADLVGPDFVLDFKTDSGMSPEEHRFQLWAYARALGKPKAYIAYLRHDVLYKFENADLAEIDGQVSELIEGIVNGKFVATPDEDTCRWCSYKEICSFRV